MDEFFPESRPIIIDNDMEVSSQRQQMITQCAPTGVYPAK